MLIPFDKYHALRNDFIVIEKRHGKLTGKKLSSLARDICDRRAGVGADGIICLSTVDRADMRVDIFNADGSWAEKSGNGLRIAGVHEHLKNRRKRHFLLRSHRSDVRVSVIRRSQGRFAVKTELGEPVFEASQIPVKTRRRFMMNAPLMIHGLEFPVTCLSMGNPHTVLFVDGFEFDWKGLGAEIEVHRAFPDRTNVEFVRVVNRGKVEVRDWERGAGATGSSGTGAAAAVCSGVMLGLVDRACEVVFGTGSLFVEWSDRTNRVELTGPVEYVASGRFEFR